jgi:hypothetical protein
MHGKGGKPRKTIGHSLRPVLLELKIAWLC